MHRHTAQVTGHISLPTAGGSNSNVWSMQAVKYREAQNEQVKYGQVERTMLNGEGEGKVTANKHIHIKGCAISVK